MLLSSLGTSITNVALPTLAPAFSASFQQVQWSVIAYLLTVTALIVSNIEANAYNFTDKDFCEIFEVIFGRYDKMIKTPEGRTKMDVYYGDGTADGISSIFFAFEQFKKDMIAREGRTKSMRSGGRR